MFQIVCKAVTHPFNGKAECWGQISKAKLVLGFPDGVGDCCNGLAHNYSTDLFSASSYKPVVVFACLCIVTLSHYQEKPKATFNKLIG